MLHQMKVLSSGSFCRLWSVMRSLSTSALCKQQPSPWLNVVSPNTEPDRSSPEEKNQRDREDLAAAYRGLAYYGLSEGVCNHLTSRAPARNGDGEVMLVVKYGLHWTEVTASSLLGVDLENGRVVEGDGKPELSAAEIHSAVHRHVLNSKQSTKAVFHTHPPYATALACLKDPTLQMIHQNCARFFKDIAYDDGFSGLVDTNKEGDRIAKQMDGKSVMLMGNHGILVTGETTAEALDKTYYLERAAQVQVIGMSTGKEMLKMSDDVASLIKQQMENDSNFFVSEHLEAIKRLMARTYPSDFTS